jgi:hypothetical protein
MKFEGRGGTGVFVATSLEEGEFVALMLLLFYMGSGEARLGDDL